MQLNQQNGHANKARYRYKYGYGVVNRPDDFDVSLGDVVCGNQNTGNKYPRWKQHPGIHRRASEGENPGSNIYVDGANGDQTNKGSPRRIVYKPS